MTPNVIRLRPPPLPPGPVQPAGVHRPHWPAEDWFLLRVADGSVRVFGAENLTRRRIARLYATAPELLAATWPRPSGRGWDPELAQASIIASCRVFAARDPDRSRANWASMQPEVPPMPSAPGAPRPIGHFEGYGLLLFGDVVRAVPFERLGRQTIAHLYAGAPELLEQTWPHPRRGWDHERASVSIIGECGKRERVDPERCGLRTLWLRPGCWRVHGQGHLPPSKEDIDEPPPRAA